jgi:hypothetical protein
VHETALTIYPLFCYCFYRLTTDHHS